MILHVPQALTVEELAECRQLLRGAWGNETDTTDGTNTTDERAAQEARPGLRFPETRAEIGRLREIVKRALLRHPLFFSAALPNRMFPMTFERHDPDSACGSRIDPAILSLPGTTENMRADVSTTLFLSDPDDYDGGELVVEDTYGSHTVKLPAGDAVLHPATALLRIEPVTRGTRLCASSWIQSMVRDNWKRNMLFDLDFAIQRLQGMVGDNAEVVALTTHYHNLLRLWVEV
jgi:PKHD-type hydroxylase